MAGEIYIADKETLDSVKQDTVEIKNNVGKIDGNQYKRVVKDSVTSLTTIVDITGSGYLKTAIAIQNLNQTQIKITVDGDLIFGTNLATLNSISSNTYSGVGLCQEIYSVYTTTTGVSVSGMNKVIQPATVDNKNNLKFPYNSLQTPPDYGCIIPVGNLIRFNSSLKVEVCGGNNCVEYFLD